MSGRGHIVDIDTLVLNGVDVTRPERARALIEAQLTGALAGVRADTRLSGVRGESAIAAEVSRAVIASLPGARNGS